MKFDLRVLSGALAVGIGLLAVASGQDTVWTARYDQGKNYDDEAQCMARSPDGGVVLAGTSMDTIRMNMDLVTVKFSRDGEFEWSARYNYGTGTVEDAFDVAVDDDGNVFVAGQITIGTSHDFLLLKYGANGDYQWYFRFPSAGQDEAATAVVPDQLGGCYGAGYSQLYGDVNWLVCHMSATGALTWWQRNGGAGKDYVADAAMDGDGNLFVTGSGYTSDEDSFDYRTALYDTATGGEAWVRLYDGSGELGEDPKNDRPAAIAVDDDGNVYVTGSSGEIVTGMDATTVKYAPDGQQLWVHALDVSPEPRMYDVDAARAIVLASDGAVYCCGRTYYVHIGEDSENDALVYRIKPDGTTDWVRTYYFENEDNEDSAVAVTVDQFDNVYVSANVDRTVETESDWATLKYSAAGELRWVEYYGEPISWDAAVGVLADESGDIFVGGTDAPGDVSYDYCLVRYTEEDAGAGTVVLADTVRVGATVTPKAWVHNYGGMYRTFPVRMEIGAVYTDIRYVGNLAPYESTLVSFASWPVRDAGAIAIRCYTQLTGDKDPVNDTSYRSVVSVPAWEQLASMLVRPEKARDVKDGGALAFAAESLMYAFKGNNTTEFYSFNIRTGNWSELESIPRDAIDGSKKRVKKGACLEHGLGKRLYAFKGGNTLQFWRYHLAGDTGWAQMTQDYPLGLKGKRVKGGTGLAYVPAKNRLYSCKGGNTNEFYAFNFATNTWLTMESVPGGERNRRCKDGTVMAYDGTKTIYLVKGGGYDMWSYDIDANRWTDRKDLRNSRWSLKNRKMKKGAGAAYDTLFDRFYITKGGKLSEFWYFDPARDTWVETDDSVPKDVRTPAPYSGSCLEYGDGKMYFLRGNKTLEFWRYNANFPLTTDGGSGVQAGAVLAPVLGRPELAVAPNPFSDRALVRYSLARPGPVRLGVYDINGRCVRVLADGWQPAGDYRVSFSDDRLANGIYLLRLRVGGEFEVTSKLLLAR